MRPVVLVLLVVALAAPAARAATPPQTTITAGPSGGTRADATPTFTFRASRPDAVFVCRIDDAPARPCRSGRPLPKLEDGPHVLRVAARSRGRVDPTPDVRRFAIDTVGPGVVITSGPPRTTTQTIPTFTFLARTTEPTAGFECSVDDGPKEAWGRCTAVDRHRPENPLAPGTWFMRVRAFDRLGNRGVPAFRIVTVRPEREPAPPASSAPPPA